MSRLRKHDKPVSHDDEDDLQATVADALAAKPEAGQVLKEFVDKIAAEANQLVAEEHVWQAANGNRRVVYVAPGTSPVAPDTVHVLLKELNKVPFDTAEALAKALTNAH